MKVGIAMLTHKRCTDIRGTPVVHSGEGELQLSLLCGTSTINKMEDTDLKNQTGRVQRFMQWNGFLTGLVGMYIIIKYPDLFFWAVVGYIAWGGVSFYLTMRTVAGTRESSGDGEA